MKVAKINEMMETKIFHKFNKLMARFLKNFPKLQVFAQMKKNYPDPRKTDSEAFGGLPSTEKSCMNYIEFMHQCIAMAHRKSTINILCLYSVSFSRIILGSQNLKVFMD